MTAVAQRFDTVAKPCRGDVQGRNGGYRGGGSHREIDQTHGMIKRIEGAVMGAGRVNIQCATLIPTLNPNTAPTLIRPQTPHASAVLRKLAVVGLLVVGSCLTGCSLAAGWGKPESNKPLGARRVESVVSVADDNQAVVERQAVEIETEKLAAPPATFRVGAGDKLLINVNGQAELSTVVPGGQGGVLGARVDGNGDIQLPLIGRIQVNGKTTAEIQDLLIDKYKQYIKEPWIIVEILEFRSQPIYLVGQFNEPGVIYMNRKTNVLQAIAKGRGASKDAYLRGARLLRDDQMLAVDIYELLNGEMDHNIWLWPEDTIYIPSDDDQKVFVLGDVGRPGAVDMENGRLTLSKAIAMAEGFNRVGNAVDRIHLIRSLSPTRGELIVVDLTKILNGEALPFALMPGDVVYLPRTKGGQWNDAVETMMPTLRAVGLGLGSFTQALLVTGAN